MHLQVAGQQLHIAHWKGGGEVRLADALSGDCAGSLVCTEVQLCRQTRQDRGGLG